MGLLGLPDPLLWGTLAFLLNYIPILGPLTGVVIFFFVGLFSFRHLVRALLPPAIYLLIHVMEGETHHADAAGPPLHPEPGAGHRLAVFWDWLWGVVGALLGSAAAGDLQDLCDHVDALTPIGHVLGAPKGHGLRA